MGQTPLKGAITAIPESSLPLLCNGTPGQFAGPRLTGCRAEGAVPLLPQPLFWGGAAGERAPVVSRLGAHPGASGINCTSRACSLPAPTCRKEQTLASPGGAGPPTAHWLEGCLRLGCVAFLLAFPGWQAALRKLHLKWLYLGDLGNALEELLLVLVYLFLTCCFCCRWC